MVKYKCKSNDFLRVANGDTVEIKEGKAYDTDGDELDVDIEYIKTNPEDFEPVAEALVEKPETPVVATDDKVTPNRKFSVVRKIGKRYGTIDEAVSASKRMVSQDLYIIEVLGHIKTTRTVEF